MVVLLNKNYWGVKISVGRACGT